MTLEAKIDESELRRMQFNHIVSDELVVLRFTAKTHLPTIRALLAGGLGYFLWLKAECT